MRILIIEDEKEIADGINAILVQEGYETDVVYDGISGLIYIRRGVYDLVLLDVMLPGANGFDVIKTVRHEGINTPVILLTARGLPCDKIKGLDLGADDYLTKPFDAGELLARIRARIRSAYSDAYDKGKLVVFDMELDPARYTLACKDKEIKLSNKEFQLMEYLMLNRGLILSRDMIAVKVWGIESEAEYNSVDVYISFVRKKMKFIGTKAENVTKKGVGYSLEEHG